LWVEARGENIAGQIAVAWTIRNRVDDGGEGYARVCQAKYQFSCWNSNDPNFAYLSGAKPIPAGQFAQAQKVADLVMRSRTHGTSLKKTWWPSFSICFAPTVQVGAFGMVVA
jgi:hypothetical protein